MTTNSSESGHHPSPVTSAGLGANQPSNPYNNNGNSAKPNSGRRHKPTHKASLWNQLPRWLRQTRQLLSQPFHANAPRHPADATELHCYFPPHTNQPYTYWGGVGYNPAQGFHHPLTQHLKLLEGPHPLDNASFQFALQQVPAVEKVTFSGWGEPVTHGDLPAMIESAVAFNNTVTQVYSHGLFTPTDSRCLFQSPLDHLVIQMVADTPALFSAVTGGAALSPFQQRLALLPKVLQQRQQLSPRTVVDVAMVVDTVTVFHLPTMIEQAAKWGADGLVLESRLALPDVLASDLTLQASSNHHRLGPTTSPQQIALYQHQDRTTLTNTHQRVVDVLQELQAQSWPLRVEWPTLHQPSHQPKTGCPATNHTLSIQPSLATSNCPRQLAITASDGNIWEANAWQSPANQQLRQLHHTESQTKPSDLPLACYWCPRHP